MAGYVTTILAFVCAELHAQAGSFCDFWKMTYCDFTAFYSILTQAKVYFWDVLTA